MVEAEWVGRVRIAYDQAKMRAVLDTGGEVDPEAIQSKVEEIGDSLDRFQTVKRKCTIIRDNENAIDEAGA